MVQGNSTLAKIQAVVRHGKRLRSEGLEIFFLKREEGEGNAFFVIPKKTLRGAVKRNRLKRKLRECYRCHKDRLPTGYDFVFRITQEVPHDQIDSRALEKRWDELLKKFTLRFTP